MTPRGGALAVLALAAALAAGLLAGPADLAPGDVLATLTAPGDAPPLARAVVWDLRIPRILVAGLVGAALSGAGVVTQGFFRNPMAGPGVLGLSACGALAATAGIALGGDAAGPMATPALAALGVATGLIALLGFARPGSGPATLLLAGIALSALASALSTLVLALSTEQWDLARRVLAWLMGSFESRSYEHVLLGVLPVALGLVAAAGIRGDLDVLVLGHEPAASLGVHPRTTALVTVAAVALLVGAATAMAGVIGFVGLIVPHLVRLRVGPRHGPLLAHAVLWGAAAMVAVDTIARAATLVPLPPGVATSLAGAPLFLWMLRRSARGWVT